MAVVFLYVAARCWFVSVTHDEAITFLYARHASLWELLTWKQATANTHLLNSLLIQFFTRCLPLHEFVLRIPALIGFAAYLAGCVRLLRRFVEPKLHLAAACLLLLNPFLLELFSVARGYALAQGLLLLATYDYLCIVTGNRTVATLANYRRLAVYMTLAIFANLAYLQIYCAMIVAIALSTIWQRRLTTRQETVRVIDSWPLWISLSIVAIAFIHPVRRMLREDAFYYGGDRGFFHDTVLSSMDAFLYGMPYDSWARPMALFVVATILVLGVFGSVDRCSPSAAIAARTASRGLLLLLFLGYLVVEGQHLLFSSRYVVGRTATHFQLLFLVFTIMVWQTGRYSTRRPFKGMVDRLFPCIAGALLLHAARALNLRSTYLWRYDADTKEIMQDLRQVTDNRLPDVHTIGSHWILTPAIAYYKAQYNMDWLSIHGDEGSMARYDYYVLTRNTETVKEHGLQDAREILDDFALAVVKEYPFTENILATSLKKALPQSP